jgi:raffinose/stachyose/melibiose transport system substrate-binding protein
MGNFIWPVMQNLNANIEDFGLMPVPVSNNESDANNRQLLSLFSMYICVDKAQNTPEQQGASKKFIEWILYSESGQNEMINKLSLVPAYKHFTIETREPLSASLIKYLKANQALDFNILYPSDHWQVLGGSMQKYLADQADRKTLAEEIETYWENVK